MLCRDVVSYLDTLLNIDRFQDYCSNGLQVEGTPTLKRILAGVTANDALIEAAIHHHADALLVHHGWFWKGEDPRVIGIKKARLQKLLAHNINLIAYHLPLDAHSSLGNNAQLAQKMNWQVEGYFGPHDLGVHGHLMHPMTLHELTASIETEFSRTPLVIGPPEKTIRRIGWCSGGAQNYFEPALSADVDAFFTGEISEHCVHIARESGVAYIAAGHHATERYGILALSEHLRAHFGLECLFVDIDSPV